MTSLDRPFIYGSPLVFRLLSPSSEKYPPVMSAFIGKTGKKLFAQHLQKYAPEDPLYEFYTNDHGKQKRRKVSHFLLLCQILFNDGVV